MIRCAIVAAPLLVGLVWVADRAAGTYWALPFAVAAVAGAFSVDRFYVLKARRQMRRYHVLKNGAGETIAYFPKDRAA